MNPSRDPDAFTIDVVSDVVCPWCYIGKRRLEAALALPGASALGTVNVRWHPFQLNPDMPPAGIPRQQYLQDKFGGPERAAEIYARVRSAAKQAGLKLELDRIALQPNTLAAHTLIAFAQASGADASDIKERLLGAYFKQGRFIGAFDVLSAIAAEGGLDPVAAYAFITDATRLKQVAMADAKTRTQGITGVPFFIFNQKVAVSGAQDEKTLLKAMLQAV